MNDEKDIREEDIDDVRGLVEDVFSSFLTAEDTFRLEFEKYYPELIKRIKNNTTDKDNFSDYTAEMMNLAEDAGLNLKQYTLEYMKEHEEE